MDLELGRWFLPKCYTGTGLFPRIGTPMRICNKLLQRARWINKQAKRLLEEDVGQVIDCLKQLPTSTNKKTELQKSKLINYYTKNKKRMSYRIFLKRGFLIGSGAIESAHRTVLQQRMKLSGQRWTKKGFQQMANIRATKKSGNWDRIINLTKIAA